MSTVPARLWGGATVVVGAAMLIRPAGMTGLVSRGASAPNPTVVRVLGARQFLQGAAVLARPDIRFLLEGGSAVDVVHAVSMVAAARIWPRYRRSALASAVIAGTSAVAGAVITRRPR